jgi:hypothetical protein
MVDTTALKSGNLIGGIGFSIKSLGTVGTVLLWILGIVVFLAIVGGIIYWWYQKKVYNQTIKIYSKIGNYPRLKVTDKAKYFAVGLAGDRLFVLRSLKKNLPPPTIQAGPNEWWYWEREDGELINIGPTDVDEVHRKLNVKFVDTDMRMSRVGIEKILRDRLQKQTFWAKYGQTVMSLIFVIFIMISLVVLFSKLKDLSVSLKETSDSVNNMAGSVRLFYESREGGKSPSDVGTSGLVPVS